MLTQLMNESAPSGEQAQGAVAFSRLGDGKPHNKTAAGTAGAPLEVLFCQEGSLEVEAPGRRAQAKKGTVLLFSAVPGNWSVCANAEFRGAVLTLERAGLSAFGRKFGGFALNENSAHRLEASGGCALLQVAADVGYGSVSQFGQAFRRQYGVSPAQYRRING